MQRPSELVRTSASTPAVELVAARSFDAHARRRCSSRHIQHMRGEPGHERCTSYRSAGKFAACKPAYTPKLLCTITPRIVHGDGESH